MNGDTIKRIIAIVCRLIIGCVFLFSGFVKSVDPVGTYYKICDYLEVIGWTNLYDLAMVAAFLLIIAELTIGFNMVVSLQLKLTSIGTAVFMAFMTGLTLYLAIANPISDCGCFGDAVVLTNWETFFKNVGLDVALIVLLLTLKYDKPYLSNEVQWVAMLIPVLGSFAIEMYCYRHLPIIDFRSYKVGNNIQELMAIPDDAPVDKYKTTFIYSKDGVEKEFTLDNYPADDPSWVFVRQNVELVEKGYVPPIHDFSIVVDGEDDITDLVLERDGYTLLIISPKLENADKNYISDINDMTDWANEKDIPVYWLTSTFHSEINDFVEKYNIRCTMAQTDEITLKTIVRSNPGLVLLEKGTVIKKWHCIDFPSSYELERIINKKSKKLK